MSEKAMVLCSGGVDSTTCLALAIEKHGKGRMCVRCPFTTVRSTLRRSRLQRRFSNTTASRAHLST